MLAFFGQPRICSALALALAAAHGSGGPALSTDVAAPDAGCDPTLRPSIIARSCRRPLSTRCYHSGGWPTPARSSACP